jgi:hypothetical protein
VHEHEAVVWFPARSAGDLTPPEASLTGGGPGVPITVRALGRGKSRPVVLRFDETTAHAVGDVDRSYRRVRRLQYVAAAVLLVTLIAQYLSVRAFGAMLERGQRADSVLSFYAVATIVCLAVMAVNGLLPLVIPLRVLRRARALPQYPTLEAGGIVALGGLDPEAATRWAAANANLIATSPASPGR